MEDQDGQCPRVGRCACRSADAGMREPRWRAVRYTLGSPPGGVLQVNPAS